MAWQASTQVLLATYSTVLVSELIGDRSILTIASLTLRFRPAATLCGVGGAFMGKMAVAVQFGHLLTRIPTRWTSGLSAATLLATAVWVWTSKQEEQSQIHLPVRWRNGVAVAFAAIFFSEWGDPGQIAAAVLAASRDAPCFVWVGGTLALCTKGVLAMTLGVGVRRHISDRLARTLSSTCCLALGLISLRDVLAV